MLPSCPLPRVAGHPQTGSPWAGFSLHASRQMDYANSADSTSFPACKSTVGFCYEFSETAMGKLLPALIKALDFCLTEDALQQILIQRNGKLCESPAVKKVKTVGTELIELVQNLQRNRKDL